MRRATPGADLRTRRRMLLGLGVALCALLAPSAALLAAEPPIKVIVHPSRAGTLSISEAGAIYLRKKRFWSDGQAIVPINRESGSAGRERFSLRVFGQDSRRLAGYWNQRYFEAGEFPPATLASDDAVIRFVADHPNAIGYVLGGDPGASVAIVLELPAAAGEESLP